MIERYRKGLSSSIGASGKFGKTQWDLVARASRADQNSTEVRTAVEELYGAYSLPIYFFIRRRGRNRHDAQDLTQEFFLNLLEKKTLSRADPARGKFRTFLLGALQYFLADKADFDNAKKRGGGSAVVFLDDDSAERQYQLAAPIEATAEELFQRRWAVVLTNLTMLRLQEEMEASGKARQFEALRGLITGNDPESQRNVANRLGISAEAVRTTLHRLRSRYRDLLREEVARTVANPQDVEGELKELRGLLRSM
jgi:RNA polymerase sigma-70 factor (ECF subfamily)